MRQEIKLQADQGKYRYPRKNNWQNIEEGGVNQKIQIWNEEYNNLEHCGLNGKTPNEMIKSLILNEAF